MMRRLANYTAVSAACAALCGAGYCARVGYSSSRPSHAHDAKYTTKIATDCARGYGRIDAPRQPVDTKSLEDEKTAGPRQHDNGPEGPSTDAVDTGTTLDNPSGTVSPSAGPRSELNASGITAVAVTAALAAGMAGMATKSKSTMPPTGPSAVPAAPTTPAAHTAPTAPAPVTSGLVGARARPSPARVGWAKRRRGRESRGRNSRRRGRFSRRWSR